MLLRFSKFSFKQKTLIKKVYREAIKFLHVEDIFEIEFNNVSLLEIKEMNLMHRGIDRATDVLSFPYIQFEKPFDKIKYQADINPQTNRVMLGEIDICYDIAKEQAVKYEHTIDREISFLALHGILHLFGYDHIDKEDEEQMIFAQKEIFAKLSKKNKKLKRD